MLTFRRALMAAAVFLTMVYLVTRTHTPPAPEVLLKDTSISKQGEKNTADSKTTPGSSAASTVDAAPIAPKKKPQPAQTLLQDLSRAPLKAKLAYQFPYDV